MPMRAALCRVLLTCSLLTSGCHCCSWSECYNDHIDDISDSSPHFDRWYCERLDVTRWCMHGRCGNNCRR